MSKKKSTDVLQRELGELASVVVRMAQELTVSLGAITAAQHEQAMAIAAQAKRLTALEKAAAKVSVVNPIGRSTESLLHDD